MRKLSFVVWLIIALPALSLFAEQPQDRVHLVKISISGSQRYQPQDVLRATGLKENSLVTRQELDASGKRLIDSGVFTAVEYAFKPAANVRGVEANFLLKDSDKFLPAEFENFVWWSDQELEALLRQAVPLYQGRVPLAGTLPDDMAAALTKLLEAKGVTSKVTWQQWAAIGELPSVYRFKAVSGVPKIKDVQLTNAGHVPPDALGRFVDSLKGHDYLHSELQKDLDRILVPAYLENGYVQFKVASATPAIADDKTLALNVTVAEGSSYRLTAYAWSGNTVSTADQLARFVSAKSGEPVNFSRLQTDLEKARKSLGKFGRLMATIKPVAAFSGESVSYDFQVTEGETYHMGELEIEGLDSTAAQKMRDLWKMPQGAVYDNTYVAYFVTHLVLRRPGYSFSCEYLEQQDDAQKVVNVKLQVRADGRQ